MACNCGSDTKGDGGDGVAVESVASARPVQPKARQDVSIWRYDSNRHVSLGSTSQSTAQNHDVLALTNQQ